MKVRLAVMTLELHLHASNSLKHKRMIMNSLKARIRNRFNVSVAEVGGQDKWQRADLAVCHVSTEKSIIEKTMEGVYKICSSFNGVQVLQSEMETI